MPMWVMRSKAMSDKVMARTGVANTRMMLVA